MEETKYHDRRQGLWQEQFAAGLSFDDYVATGSEQQQADWSAARERVVLTVEQEAMLGSWPRQMNVLILSGIW